MKTVIYNCPAILMILLMLCLSPAPASAVEVTAGDCYLGCGTSNNSCYDCCNENFPECKGPCLDAYETCQSNCGLGPQTECRQACKAQLTACNQACTDKKVDISCPGWVDPNQKCAYDCQMWNPASRSCVGPSMNGCSY